MPPITPKRPIGTLSSSLSMRVVICPKCRQKRWANKMKNPSEWRTTCCGKVISP